MTALGDILLLLSPLLCAVVLAMLALAAGSPLAARLAAGKLESDRRFVDPAIDAPFRLALAVTLGLGVLGQALFLCALGGRFGAGALAIVAALALAAGRGGLVAALRDPSRLWRASDRGGAGSASGSR